MRSPAELRTGNGNGVCRGAEDGNPLSKQASKRIGGRAVIATLLVGVAVLGVLSYYYVPPLIGAILEKRPGRLAASFDALEAALRAYHADHHALPPEHDMIRYRRRNKNLEKTHAFGVRTVSIPSLTTPVSYLDYREIGDPYAMPEQYVPPAYLNREIDGERVAVIYSPASNLIYDIRPAEVGELPTLAAFDDYLSAHTYDPTNGTQSGGDVFRRITFSFD